MKKKIKKFNKSIIVFSGMSPDEIEAAKEKIDFKDTRQKFRMVGNHSRRNINLMHRSLLHKCTRKNKKCPSTRSK